MPIAKQATAKELRDRFPDLGTVTAMFADSNGIMRGKVLPSKELDKLMGEGVLLQPGLFGADATGETVDETELVWETGDADYPFRAVPETFFAIPGTDGREAAVMIQMMQPDGATPHPLDPRGILAGVVERLNADGIFPVVAPELEFYIVTMDNDASGMGRPAPIPGADRPQETNQVYGIDVYQEFAPVVDAIRHACGEVSVAADTAIAEYGRGQFEINIHHNSDPVRAGDEAALLRHLARRVARGHGLDVTFMGKPFDDDTGSGFHLHASLWDAKGGNILAEKKGGEPWDSPKMAHAAGGLARFLGESMAVFAPNANAWRRLQPGQYAPTDRSWGYNNRTVNFRIPAGGSGARRLEHRASSADVNPYLATALVLAAMAEGIRRKLEPPPITTGNAYDSPQRDGLPGTWAEALELFGGSDFVADWLGEEYRRVYTVTKTHERRAFLGRVTALDWAWYR